MNDKWFFIGSIVGIFAGITIGKIMFDDGDKIPTVNKWSCQKRVKDLEKENKMLNDEINILIQKTDTIN